MSELLADAIHPLRRALLVAVLGLTACGGAGSGTGGDTATGGSPGTGGDRGSGGAVGSGGSLGSGGALGSGGNRGSGGNLGSGGGASTGGVGAGGSVVTGGTSGGAGTGGNAGGRAGGSGGRAGGGGDAGSHVAGTGGQAGSPGTGGTLGSGALIKNDLFWKDSTGNLIYSQGGGVLKAGATYYWYGVNYAGAATYAANPSSQNSNTSFVAVTTYSSTDLASWKFEGNALTYASMATKLTMTSDTWIGRVVFTYKATT